MKIKQVYIFGGGTVAHIANHFAVCAPAYGTTAKTLRHIMEYDKRFDNMRVNMELTKKTGGYNLR